jgi:hypothetical protein
MAGATVGIFFLFSAFAIGALMRQMFKNTAIP